MKHLYKLQTITAMKLDRLKELTLYLEEAQERGWNTSEIISEIAATKDDAMNPQQVIDQILKAAA